MDNVAGQCPQRLSELFTIVHEDADLLVINKAAGLVCHPTKNGELSSLIGRARLYLDGKAAPHLVNRLDRETSGLVMIAKNSLAAGELGKNLEARTVEKEYLAIVHGHPGEEHGLIDAPLGKDEASQVAVKDCVRPDGAAAQTEFFVERKFFRTPGVPLSEPARSKDVQRAVPEAGAPFTLLRVRPRTGRKHQIRIHLAHAGHPIVGDKIYGGDEDLYLALVQQRLNAEQLEKLILPHHALHGGKIAFDWRGARIEFGCAPEAWFTAFHSGTNGA